MAANPDLNLGPFAQDRDVAQLLASVLEGQVRQVEAVQRLGNDLQIMRQNQRVAHDQWRNRHHRGLRAPLPSIRNCLHWLDDPSAPRENNILGDIDFAYGPLEDICDLILAELGREELEGDEDGPGSDLEDNGMVGAGASRHNSYGPGDGQHRVGPIRPTGRAIRRRRPYTPVSLNFDDRTFRILYRMSQATFWSVIDLIRQNEVFINRGRRKQRPVYHQLAVFLIKYGSMGMRSTFMGLLTLVGKGTVPLYCERVVYAIRDFGLTCVGWPNAERKEEIKAAFMELCGLDGIIGVLDGSLIDLSKRLPGSEESFRSRKGTIATNIQAIVDHEGRFISFETGFPGSRNDSSVWKRSFVWKHRRTHFGNGEFLLADGGYPLSPFVLTPFARNERQGDDRVRRVKFNRCISKARVLIERTFGQLKARFPALTMVGDVRDQDTLYHAIEAMMVLHNICYDLHDTVSGEPDAFTEAGNTYDAVGQEPDDLDWGPGANVNEELLTAGRAFRIQCMDIICPI